MELGEEQVAAAWDANAATWVEHVRAGYDLYREAFTLPAFRAFSPDLRGLQVIDLGCGEGHNARAGAAGRSDDRGRSVAQDDRGRASEAAEPLGIRYRVGSFTRLDFCDDASFDGVVSTMALMDSPDFGAAARAAHRVLRPGGGFWFSVLHPCFITAGTKWLRNERGRETGLTVTDYFSARAYLEHWRFKAPETSSAEPFRVPRFSQRLEDYVNGLCAAGFRITRMAEPRPTAAQCNAHPWLARWRRHAALVLLIATTKT